MDNWDEVRTAYQVARLGTVSGAAEILGVHHATVIRHIDALEARLGVKLFQRHARGYTPTEAGEDLLKIAQATEDQFNQLVGRIKGRGDSVTGELVVTSLSSLSPLITPSLAEFQRANRSVTIRFLTGERLFRLEYGEAHVAIRAGRAPDQPDNVVQPLMTLPMSMVAHRDYVERYGKPDTELDLKDHYFVVRDSLDPRAPFLRWLADRVSPERFAFRAAEELTMMDAIKSGAGIGFMPTCELPRLPDLVEIMSPREEWESELWLVTHVDLHRTPKVQALLKFLKESAKHWA